MKGKQKDDKYDTTDTESTWSIEITEETDKKVSEENTNGTEEEQREEEETEIEINDLEQVNRIYRKYLKDPKDPDVGEEEMNLEILLINSLKINIGKIQEITDGFLVEKEYISIFCLTETKENCANFQKQGITLYDK